jgi:hypothetical protein
MEYFRQLYADEVDLTTRELLQKAQDEGNVLTMVSFVD